MTEPDTIDIEDHLHLGTGSTADERTIVVSAVDPINERLKSLDRGSAKIEAWIENRDERGQFAYVSLDVNPAFMIWAYRSSASAISSAASGWNTTPTPTRSAPSGATTHRATRGRHRQGRPSCAGRVSGSSRSSAAAARTP